MYNFLYPPKFDSYSERYKFKTIYFQSINNVIATKPTTLTPKLYTSYRLVILESSVSKELGNVIYAHKGATVRHPIWGDATYTNTFVDNQDIIYCDTVNISVGDIVVIFSTRLESKYSCTVLDVTTNYIKVDTAVTSNVGDIVIPTFIGYLEGEVVQNYSKIKKIEIDIKVSEL